MFLHLVRHASDKYGHNLIKPRNEGSNDVDVTNR